MTLFLSLQCVAWWSGYPGKDKTRSGKTRASRGLLQGSPMSKLGMAADGEGGLFGP